MDSPSCIKSTLDLLDRTYSSIESIYFLKHISKYQELMSVRNHKSVKKVMVFSLTANWEIKEHTCLSYTRLITVATLAGNKTTWWNYFISIYLVRMNHSCHYKNIITLNQIPLFDISQVSWDDNYIIAFRCLITVNHHLPLFNVWLQIPNNYYENN